VTTTGLSAPRYFLSSVLARAGRGDRNRQPVSLLGHTAAAWPVSVIGSRRLVGSPQGSGKGIAHPQFSTRQLAGSGLADVGVGSRLLDNAGSLSEAQNGCHPNRTSVTSFSWSDALRCTFALRREMSPCGTKRRLPRRAMMSESGANHPPVGETPATDRRRPEAAGRVSRRHCS
jgi:hypothetical protein